MAAGWDVAARTERQQHWNFIAASGAIAGEYAAGSMPSWDPVTPYRPGDMIHPDCYGYVDGYMYDVQRTVIVGAKPTARQQWLIDGSWDHAQLLGAALRDGVTCREIHQAGSAVHGGPRLPGGCRVEGVVGDGRALRPRVSSGFDWPWLGSTGPLVDQPLKAPYAVTIELYWQEPGVGQAWVEENWLVLPNGSERLSASLPKTYGPDGEPIWG